MAEFRLATSYKNRTSMLERPPLPKWLRVKRNPHWHRNRLRGYDYWTSIWWATPPWITDDMIEQMRAIYASATPADHVDHIVPLNGTLVCGLHVPWNLRVVPAAENLQKSNNTWPDMPFEIECMFEHHENEPHQMVLL